MKTNIPMILRLTAPALLLVAAAPLTAQEEAPRWTPPTEFHAQTVCPISGETLEDHETFVDYEGHRTYLCCAKCVKKFSAAPDLQLYRMYLDGVAPENLQTTCPVSGKPLESRDHVLQVLNRTVYFASAEDAAKGAKDPAAMLDKLAGRHAQEKCAVMGGDVDPDGSFVVAGQTVRYCCPGCESKFRAEPAKYFAVLAERHAVLEPAAATCLVHPDKPVKSRAWFVTLGARRYFFHDAQAQHEFFADPAHWLADLAPAEAQG